MEDLKFLLYAFNKLNSIGQLPNGGVCRLAYSDEENAIHRELCDIAVQAGFDFKIDDVGNTFINPQEGQCYIIGSHLDTVPDGGKYDGVAGILTGLLLLKWDKELGLGLPVTVAAFRCEESSRFGRATIGSSLCTNRITKKELINLKDKNGISILNAIESCGFIPVPYLLTNIKAYMELHIEQGRVLENMGIGLGIVTSIATPTRFQLKIYGRQDHSGATPMFLRKDSLCAAAEIINAVESLGQNQSSLETVATVGCINNEPNAMNVVPGFTELFIDIRGVDKKSISCVTDGLKECADSILKRRGLSYTLTEICREDPVNLSTNITEGLQRTAEEENIAYHKMPSGAGHDAIKFAQVTDAGMLFIPSKGGVSHNPGEVSDLNDIISGAKVMLKYIQHDHI